MSAVHVFATPAEFFAFVLGPRPHDAHVQRWRNELWMRERQASHARATQAVHDYVKEIAEGEARKLAETFGYDTAALRAEHHRWSAGCFMYQPFAKTRARQLGRALDIACERHALAVAAE